MRIDAVLHIERYPTADAESIPDAHWIREAAARGDIILTRDGNIRRREAELAAIIDAEARCFVLETGNATPLDYLRALMIAWPRVQEILDTEAAPFMYGNSRKGVVRRRYPSAGSEPR